MSTRSILRGGTPSLHPWRALVTLAGTVIVRLKWYSRNSLRAAMAPATANDPAAKTSLTKR